MKIAIVYASKTGNTEELLGLLHKLFLKQMVKVELYRVEQFPISKLSSYDGVVVGTYSWGDGEIPKEMLPLYEAFETQNVQNLITGIVGTGDRFYPKFCGAVDEFRDMLYVQTNLAVTLKVELMPQLSDWERCLKFVELFLERSSSRLVSNIAK